MARRPILSAAVPYPALFAAVLPCLVACDGTPPVHPGEPAHTAASVTPAPSASASSATAATVHTFGNNWGNGLGCTPRGDELTLTGKIIVQPFGKGSDGAVLQAEEAEWVLSYRAEGVLLALHGKTVTARGRACDKEGEAVGGPHLDLRIVTEAPSAGDEP